MLIYIHGFNSSPASSKAQLLKARLEALGRGAEFAAPALPHSPAQAAELLDALLKQHGLFTVRRTGIEQGDCVRVTPALYNRPEDVDRLAQALRQLSRQGR